jgi:hypothetical protein
MACTRLTDRSHPLLNYHASAPSARADFNGKRGKPKDIREVWFLMPPSATWLLGLWQLDGVLAILIKQNDLK